MQNLTFKTLPEINSHQLSDCVAIVNNLTAWLCAENLKDEGVKLSLSVSIIKALNNLDTFLDDRKRWQMPKGDCHEAAQRAAEMGLALLNQTVWAGELNRQVALGNIQAVLDEREQPAEQPPQPPRRKRKK